jgi:hypothetical protein
VRSRTDLFFPALQRTYGFCSLQRQSSCVGAKARRPRMCEGAYKTSECNMNGQEDYSPINLCTSCHSYPGTFRQATPHKQNGGVLLFKHCGCRPEIVLGVRG